MKSFIRKAGLLLLLCVFFTSACLASTLEVQAASKPKFAKKTVTIVKGKTKTIKVLNAKKRVKWSSSNKKIAYVKKKSGKKHQKAVIKAKKTGTCYIKAKIGKKTIKCKVKVKKGKKTVITPVLPPDDGMGIEERNIQTRKISSSSVNLTAGLKAATPSIAAPDQAFIKGAGTFAFNLFKQTAAAEKAKTPGSNILISPDSVMTALAMTENGAAGNTLAEMQSVLGNMPAANFNRYLSGMNHRLAGSDGFIYNVSNSIWARQNMVKPRTGFLQTNLNYHDAEYYVAPFNGQTVADMNSWVYNHTRNLIDNIIARLSEDARMVLINTVVFEGKWAEPFRQTSKGNFKTYSGQVQNVTMLRHRDHYEYFKVGTGQAFAKYYRSGKNGQRIAFVGILPPSGTNIDSYIASLDGAAFINSWNSRKNSLVDLTLPEFSYDYNTEMKDSLKAMGMNEAFTDDADFSAMAEPTPETPALKISSVLHKTHIELDANGTKAAAATAVVMEKAGASMEDPIILTFNRPFVYALVDANTGIPLFIGQVNKIK